MDPSGRIEPSEDPQGVALLPEERLSALVARGAGLGCSTEHVIEDFPPRHRSWILRKQLRGARRGEALA